MILKITILAAGMEPPPAIQREGQETISVDLLGDFIRVPIEYVRAREKLVGILSPTLPPIGNEANFPAPHDSLNGLWVQPQILDYVKKQNGTPAPPNGST